MKLNLLTLSAALALTTLTTQTQAAEPETVWISSLDLSPVAQGWGQPQTDKAAADRQGGHRQAAFDRREEIRARAGHAH
jgi:hypothetical protein